MPPNSTRFLRVVVAIVPLFAAAAPLAAAPAANPPAATSGDLDGLRRKCIAAARAGQQLERTLATLERDIELMRRDSEGRQRGLTESRVEQAQLLGEIERFARHPPERFAAVEMTPIDRLRGEMLLDAVVPALRAGARALAGEIERVAALRGQIETKQRDLATARAVLAKNRDDMAKLVAQRLELERQLLPPDATAATRIAKLGHEAKDIAELIKRADAATERRDKEIAGRSKGKSADAADPTRPHDLHGFEPTFSVLTVPVSGPLSRHFAGADAAAGGQGLGFAALRGGEVVAPFDGRVVYAGPFGDLGLVLIIRHGALYHSLLAGLGRIDLRVDDWVVAGEPVGAMPDGADKPTGSALYLELRREGRPVDPQPWLAARDKELPGERGQEPNQQAGDQKVTE